MNNTTTLFRAAALVALAAALEPGALALSSSGLGIETAIDKFANFLVNSKLTYLLMLLGLGLVCLGIAFGGLQKQWGNVTNWIVAGAIIFTPGAVFEFFFSVNINSLLLP